VRLDRERLRDILEAIEAIERYTSAGREEFDRNELVRVWCLHYIEIIGEATANLSEDARGRAPNIPWRNVIGMRNILVHAYFQVDWQEIWNVVERDLAPLKLGIRELLTYFE
jgi:uncharacterized protein with HEPN domain